MKKVTVIKLRELAFCNSDKLADITVDNFGRRMRWVGIYWVEEGPSNGTENWTTVEG